MLFRNVAIMCAALALAVQAREAQVRARDAANAEDERELPDSAVVVDEALD